MRVLLFLLTNLMVVATISLLLWVLTRLGLLPPNMPLLQLLVMCFLWGMVGAWISLQMSAASAKRLMGIHLVNGRGSQVEAWLHQTVANLVRKAGLTMPEVGIYQSPEMNAFATGPSKQKALVAVSTGILNGMAPEELEAVLAHELTHVSNGDMVTMTLLQGVINAFVMFLARAIAFVLPSGSRDERDMGFGASWLLIGPLELFLGIGGSLITAGFSRRREFRADAGAARLTNPEAMVSALERLGRGQELIDRRAPDLAAFKIDGGRTIMTLFATHPPLNARIRALQRGRSPA